MAKGNGIDEKIKMYKKLAIKDKRYNKVVEIYELLKKDVIEIENMKRSTMTEDGSYLTKVLQHLATVQIELDKINLSKK